MATPATRMTIFFHHGWTENERGSSAASPSSPSSFTKPPIGQPVEGVEGLALVAQDLGPRREADAELQDAHVGQPGRDEVADLVDDHEDAEDGDEQDDRDDRLDDGGHAETPMGPLAKAAADLGIEGDQVFDARVRPAVPSEPGHGGLEQPRDGGERQGCRPGTGDRDVVGGDEGGRRPRSGDACLSRDAQRREPSMHRAPGSRGGRWRRDRPARQVTDGGRDRSWRTGSGSRMSGVPSWALREPSTKRTAEWTTLCGWMTTSIAS